MEEIQARRASLAHGLICDEVCFIVLQPNSLGLLHAHLTKGEMTQQPGTFSIIPPPNHHLVSVALAAYSSSSHDLFSRAVPEVEMSSVSQKQEAHLAMGPGRNMCVLTHQQCEFPLCQQCLPSPGTSCDIAALAKSLYQERGSDSFQEVIASPSPSPKWKSG